MPEGDQAQITGELIGGPRVTIQLKVACARRFSQHQHQQAFFSRRVGVCDDGILTHRLMWSGWSEVRATDKLASAVQVVCGDDQLVQFVVVASQRGVILVVQRSNTDDHQ